MPRRFEDNYIPRGEHQQVVSFYKKLVVHLYRQLRAVRDELHGRALTTDADMVAMNTKPTAAETPCTQQHPCNVITVDFGRRSSGA